MAVTRHVSDRQLIFDINLRQFFDEQVQGTGEFFIFIHIPFLFSGTILREIQMPLKNCTSCCFGGRNLDEMYVTSMKWDKNDSPTAGSLLKVTGLGAKGLPAVNYQARWNPNLNEAQAHPNVIDIEN